MKEREPAQFVVHIHYPRLMLKPPAFPWNLIITNDDDGGDDTDADDIDAMRWNMTTYLCVPNLKKFFF